MIQIQDIMSDLTRFPGIQDSLQGAKYCGAIPLIYRFTGVESEDPIRLDKTKYHFSIEAGPSEIVQKSGSLDMILYPEEIAYAESGYPCGADYADDALLGLLITRSGNSCGDNGCYDNMDAYMCTLGNGFNPSPEQWYDIANRYLAPDYIPDSHVHVCLMDSMFKYQKIHLKHGYEISIIQRLVQGGAVPIFWFAIDNESVTLYMASSEKAIGNLT